MCFYVSNPYRPPTIVILSSFSLLSQFTIASNRSSSIGSLLSSTSSLCLLCLCVIALCSFFMDPDAPQGIVSDYQANFTSTNGSVPKLCDRCHESWKYKDMVYMLPTDPGRKGRSVCPPCHNYYQQKQGTVRRTGMWFNKFLPRIIMTA